MEATRDEREVQRAAIAWLRARFRDSCSRGLRRTCRLCGGATEVADWCSSCRAASAFDSHWRLRRLRDDPAPLAVFSLGRYRGPDGASPSPAAVALMRFKYGQDRSMGRVLMRTVKGADRVAVATDAVVVPVPLHPRRLRERGFNQAAWIARAFARRHGVRMVADALACAVHQPRRPGLSRVGRHTTSTNRFSARRRLPTTVAVVLVDDVCTTGLTLCAARRALESVGIHVRAAVVLLSTERPAEGGEVPP